MMSTLKGVKDVYSLITKILEILEQYDSEIYIKAKDHIHSAYKGSERSCLLAIIDNLKMLASDSPAEMKNELVGQKDLPIQIESTKSKSSEAKAIIKDHSKRELEAILQDSNFLPQKADLIKFVKKYVGDKVVLRNDDRESKRDISRKAIAAYKRMSIEEQQRLYRLIRRVYIKGRESGLREWAEIISNGG
jgi:glutaredoxin 2